jgi:hypothetical protein
MVKLENHLTALIMITQKASINNKYGIKQEKWKLKNG